MNQAMFWCVNCQCYRKRNPRVKHQRYCGRRACQLARKAKWQRWKMANDPQYRANQRDCQKRWRKAHPDYWRRYRKRHGGYNQRNLLLQKVRDQLRRKPNLAKMDASDHVSRVKPGSYYLLPRLAKMDTLPQEVILIPTS